MVEIKVNRLKTVGRIKPMHCVNNGPVPRQKDQVRNNFEKYAEAKIPYARNHDASFFAGYGGPHCVDVAAIFPDFDADENLPGSYDFVLTDQYIKNTLEAGTKTFYRLGTRIEHEIKKYQTLPPKDFAKWARICEHIIRHYNQNWADGFELDIEYWEIWNEADIAADDADPFLKKCWGGTKAQFFEFYSVVSNHLKDCFPELKIGGPALCNNLSHWARDFLGYVFSNKLPLDFYSWHRYARTPEDILNGSEEVRKLLDANGYEKTESICDEWNYVRGWTDEFVNSILVINSLKGASFTAATMLLGQHKNGVDMLMYYDARPCVFCGLFNFYTMFPQKPYYAIRMFSELYQSGNEAECICDENNIYACAATDDNGKTVLMFTYYSDEDNLADKEVYVSGFDGNEKVYLVDESHDMEEISCDSRDGVIRMNVKQNDIFLIKCE